MRVLGVLVAVLAVALAACGGADDGGAFSGATSVGTTTATIDGYPYGTATCDESKQARFAVPGKTAEEIIAHYRATEYVPTNYGDSPRVAAMTPADGLMIANCQRAGDRVEFTPRD